MPVQPIRLFGDPVLRTPAAPVTDFDAELATLVRDLTETMHAQGGAGLAAPQLGVSLRVFTWHVDDEVGQDDEERGDQDDPDDDGQVGLGDGAHGGPPHALEVEHGLGDDGTAE